MVKKIILFTFFISSFCNLFAQDIIVKKDGTTILSKVLKLGTSDIEYKKWSNKSGPTYVIKINQVLSINYENGEKEVFESSNEPSNKVDRTKANQNVSNLIEGNVIDLSSGTNNNQYADPYNHIYGGNSTVNAINQMYQGNYHLEIERLNRKAKSWSTTGYIFFFGVGIVGGAAMSTISEGAGYATLAGGILVGIYCIYKQGAIRRSAASLERQMKMNNVNISSVHLKEFQNSGLKAGIAMLKDNNLKNGALGLNLCYNF